MEKRVRTARAMLASIGATAVGMLFAAGSAQAFPGEPTPFIDSGGDGFINAVEITAVPVEVTYGPNLDYIEVRVVQSPTCSNFGTPTTEYQTITSPIPAGGTTTLIFDLSDAANQPRPFDEGGSLCAQARAGFDDGAEPVLGPWKGSGIVIKDTVVLAGTVAIQDPVSPDYLNILEVSNDPVGSPAGSVRGTWRTAQGTGSGYDATSAQVWWGRPSVTNVTPPDVSCGKFPATFGIFDESSTAFGGSTPNQALSKLCTTYIPDGEEISFNAQWTDAAGNISAIASTAAFPDGNLLKDITAPAAPLVDLLGASVDWQRPLGNNTTLYPVITTHDVINVANQHGVPADVDWAGDDIDFIDVSVTDGAVTRQWRGEAIDDPQRTSAFDLSAMKNCDFGFENPPVHTPVSPLANPVTPRAADCITATATLTDLAGNTSLPGTDTAYKDALAPQAPSFVWAPTNITDANDQLTRVEVTGEAYAAAHVRLTDEDPSSDDLANFDIDRVNPLPPIPASLQRFRLYETATDHQGFGAIFADVTTLADGTLTATTRIVDPYGNTSTTTTVNAFKDLTTPSLQLTSPAANSLHRATVTFEGVAKFGTTPCGDCTVTVYRHPSSATNYGNPANIPLVTQRTDANGHFKATYTYINSGVQRAFFRATSDGALPEINGRPSAVRTFRVDVKIPTVAFTSPNEGVFLPGEPVVVRGQAADDFSGLSGIELIVTQIDPLTPIGQGRPGQLTRSVMTVPGNQTNCSSCPGGLSGTWSYDFSSLPLGRYTIQARAVDLAQHPSNLSSNFNFTKLG